MRLQDAVQAVSIDMLDAELIAAAVLGKNRTWVIAHPEASLSTSQTRRLHTALKRRQRGEPVAYIIGEREFFGRTFAITKDVLIPRPSTELLVEKAALALKMNKKTFRVEDIDTNIVAVTWIWKRPGSCAIADIGTGSGCIAVTMAKLFPRRRIIATDISKKALNVAGRNARVHNARITFRSGTSLRPLGNENKPFLVVTNPPYIPDAMMLDRTVAAFEPRRALRGGKKGDGIVAEILDQALRHPFCVGVVMECRADQEPTVRALGARPI